MRINIYYYLWVKDENGKNRKIAYQGKHQITDEDIYNVITEMWEDDQLPCPMNLNKDEVSIQVDIDEVTI